VSHVWPPRSIWHGNRMDTWLSPRGVYHKAIGDRRDKGLIHFLRGGSAGAFCWLALLHGLTTYNGEDIFLI
jgi:hypothetical protein